MNWYWAGPRLTYHARGNLAVSETLEKEVRQKAAILFALMLPRQTYAIGKWKSDGSRIQVQVMRTPIGERVFARVWTPGIEDIVGTFTYYLESSFVVPSQELLTTLTTTDNRVVKDIREAIFIHGTRSRDWSTWDTQELGFTPQPIGDDLVARTQPLCLGFDEPKATLDYAKAYPRWRKTWRHFGDAGTWEQQLMQGRGSGTSTGKMVLYQRAKLGRKVGDWIGSEGIEDDYVINDWAASHTCTGLLTDARGDYWKVAISDSTTATFTKLYVEPELKQACDRAKTAQARLFIEGFVLGYSRLTDEIHTISLSGVPTLHEAGYSKWNPVAYSWHFNWDGSEATMVVHRGVASTTVNEGRLDYMQTEIWKLSLSVGLTGTTYAPSISCESGARSYWQRITALQSDIIYVPTLTQDGKEMQVWSSPGTGSVPNYSQAVDIPIYAWYGTDGDGQIENKTRYLVTYSRGRQTIVETTDPNFNFDFKVCGATVTVGGGYHKIGVTQSVSYRLVKGDSQVYSLDAQSNGAVTFKQVSLSTGEEYSVSRSISGSGLSFTDNTTCSPVSHTVAPTHPDYLVLADVTTYYWQPTVIASVDTVYDTPPSMGLVIPHDCAEGAVFAKCNLASRAGSITTKVDKPTPSIKYESYSNIRGYPSGTGLAPTYLSGRGQADFDISAVNHLLFDYDVSCIAFGRNPMSSTRYTENVKADHQSDLPTRDDPKGAPEGLSYSQYDSDNPTRLPFSIFEAFGGEMMIRAEQDHFISGFPSAFGSKLTPPVIVGSI